MWNSERIKNVKYKKLKPLKPEIFFLKFRNSLLAILNKDLFDKVLYLAATNGSNPGYFFEKTSWRNCSIKWVGNNIFLKWRYTYILTKVDKIPWSTNQLMYLV